MSKTHTELVPHIEEITRALQNEIDSHEIESELDTFVNTFGISLSEAKRAIIKKLGGNPQSLSRLRTYRVSELQPGLSRVDINGRILSVMKRTYERKGEDRNLFSGILADGTGKIEFTAWEESPMPNIITLNCACYGGGATVHAPVFQTGVRAQVD